MPEEIHSGGLELNNLSGPDPFKALYDSTVLRFRDFMNLQFHSAKPHKQHTRSHATCNLPILNHTTNEPEHVIQAAKLKSPKILTAELLEISLQLLPGTEEHSALLSAQHKGVLVMHSNAGHLGVQLGQRGALQRCDGLELKHCLASATRGHLPIISNVLDRISWVLQHPLHHKYFDHFTTP